MKLNASHASVSVDAPDTSTVHTRGRNPANETDEKPTSMTTQRRLELTLGHIVAIHALWPDLVALTDAQRRISKGRQLSRYANAFKMLFDAAAREPYASAFALLSDDGNDGARFDPAAHAAQFEHLAALRAVSDALKHLDALVDDDLLHTGARVVEPGLRVLELARTLARSNARFRAQVAPALNAVGALTARARRALASTNDSTDDSTKPA